jgi:3-methyl-2-oxobutanoate hydroxymethyltransferase
VTAEITQRLSIPTIGIGSGPHCDGQVLVLHDVLGLYDASPPFARRYVDLSATVREALSSYANDVRSGAFPAAPQTSRA